MALRAVVEHPKFADLMVRLGLPRYVALGVLESVWHFASRNTPQGNVGKYTDEQIEAWIGWTGTPGALIAGLKASKWLDADPVHRILVHDWAEHADKATKQSLKNKKLEFFVPSVRPNGTQLEPKTLTPVQVGSKSAPNPSESVQVCAPPVPVPEPVPEPGAGAVPVKKRVTALPPPPTRLDVDPFADAPDDLHPMQYATEVLKAAQIPGASYVVRVAVADTIPMIAAQEGCGMGKAAGFLLDRMRAAPDGTKWNFWLQDGGWKQAQDQGISTEGWEK